MPISDRARDKHAKALNFRVAGNKPPASGDWVARDISQFSDSAVGGIMAQIAALGRARSLSWADCAFLAEFAIRPTLEHIQSIIDGLSAQALGTPIDRAAFKILFSLIALDRRLITRNSLLGALSLHFGQFERKGTVSDVLWTDLREANCGDIESVDNLAYNSRNIKSLKSSRALFGVKPYIDRSSLRANATIDLIISIRGLAAYSRLDSTLFCCVSNDDESSHHKIINMANALAAFSFLIQEYSESCSHINSDHFESIIFNFNNSADDFVIRFCYDKHRDHFDSMLISDVINREIIEDLNSRGELSRFVIDENTQIADFVRLREIVRARMQSLFEAASYPIERQPQFIDDLISSLLVREPSARRGAEIEGARQFAVPEPLQLPNEAPAMWKLDKLEGDTPPDFIKRHYGPWLRADGTGITRQRIHQLDSSLYNATSHFLRRNEMPADCPLPTKSEAINEALSRGHIELGELSSRELSKWAMRARQREQALQKT